MSEQALPTTARAWHLEARPQGQPVPSEFALRDLELPALGAGQLLVANEYLSVDPYMRGRMSDEQVLRRRPSRSASRWTAARSATSWHRSADGFAAGRPRGTRPRLARRTLVLDAAAARRSTRRWRRCTAYLGVLGMPGLTAYVGLTRREDQARRRRSSSPAPRARSAAGRPDRQAARRRPGDRQRRLGREGQAARRGARLRRGVQLQGRRRSPSSCTRPRPTASTSTSTTSAASTWKPRSARSAARPHRRSAG